MKTERPSRSTQPSEPARDDRLLATTRWVAIVVLPVLTAAFVILYLLPERTEELWGWMVCPSMTALVMGGGYLAGAYLFTRVALSQEWHRVGVGFVGTTVFSSILLATTVLHWSEFNHDHASFWAWLVLYVTTPPLLPILWFKNRRRDPRRPTERDVVIPWSLRFVIGVGGAVQLGFAVMMFGWPHLADEVWPWPLEVPTSRALSAFVAFPAVTWLWFLFENRWSCFRITQQVATIGLVLIGVAAIRESEEFRAGWHTSAYRIGLVVAILANIALYIALDCRRNSEMSLDLAVPPAGVNAIPLGAELSAP